ncbi:MAG: ATP-grasp domain-containing protein [Muribaculaceae bacterium]|nr:ATP-grasp domain-containing protein [Muribaculaceae bacterium]
MSKNILVLPGTLWQVPLIEKIQEMGHRALVVNPDPDAPGMKKADIMLVSDIFDKQRVIDFAREQKIAGVMSDECDIAMNWVAELGKLFNVPTLDEETAALYTDKFLMREFSKQHGLKYPEYKFCKTVEDAVALLKEINRPIIIKPLDSNASHGVFKCSNEEEVRKHFEESMSFSRVEKSVLAERFIVGTEFTIDGVKTPHGHYTMAISEKKHFAHNESIANELLFSHYNPRFDYDKLRATNDAFVMKSNLQFGFTHAEYKYEDGEYYLIEIAARGGGNMISSCITNYMTGYDTYRYLVECATGNVHDEDFSLRPEFKDRAAVLKFFETPGGGGKVREIRGLDYIESEPDIKHYRLNFKIGDTIENALNDSVRIGFYIVCSENMQKLREVIKNIENNFQIIY